jgi:hypothetical protein
MFTVKLSTDEDELPLTWNTPGHIEINSNGKIISSVENGPFWILFGVPALLAGLQELVENPRETCKVHFVNFESYYRNSVNFTLEKRKKNPNTILLSRDGKVIGVHLTNEVILAFWDEINRFTSIYESLVDEDFSLRAELNESVKIFNGFVKKYLESHNDQVEG